MTTRVIISRDDIKEILDSLRATIGRGVRVHTCTKRDPSILLARFEKNRVSAAIFGFRAVVFSLPSARRSAYDDETPVHDDPKMWRARLPYRSARRTRLYTDARNTVVLCFRTLHSILSIERNVAFRINYNTKRPTMYPC